MLGEIESLSKICRNSIRHAFWFKLSGLPIIVRTHFTKEHLLEINRKSIEYTHPTKIFRKSINENKKIQAQLIESRPHDQHPPFSRNRTPESTPTGAKSQSRLVFDCISSLGYPAYVPEHLEAYTLAPY